MEKSIWPLGIGAWLLSLVTVSVPKVEPPASYFHVDFTFMALGLEKKLGIWIPRDEWSPEQIVRDVINLLERHTNSSQALNKKS
jgi:hypothetical protein